MIHDNEQTKNDLGNICEILEQRIFELMIDRQGFAMRTLALVGLLKINLLMVTATRKVV